MFIRVGFIVEGHGEVEAVPTVFRRVARTEFPDAQVICRDPFRVPRDRLLRREAELERALRFTANAVGNHGAILIVVDSDGECPAAMGPQLLERAKVLGLPLHIGVAVAHQEFENWFIAASPSLGGDPASPVVVPESIQGAKEWIRKYCLRRAYRETVDQNDLAARFDLALARTAPSFDKFYRETVRLCKLAIKPV